MIIDVFFTFRPIVHRQNIQPTAMFVRLTRMIDKYTFTQYAHNRRYNSTKNQRQKTL